MNAISCLLSEAAERASGNYGARCNVRGKFSLRTEISRGEGAGGRGVGQGGRASAVSLLGSGAAFRRDCN
eukprot:415093-Hanusia_phi.AAC.1